MAMNGQTDLRGKHNGVYADETKTADRAPGIPLSRSSHDWTTLAE